MVVVVLEVMLRISVVVIEESWPLQTGEIVVRDVRGHAPISGWIREGSMDVTSVNSSVLAVVVTRT